MKYWDSSALLALLVREEQSDRLEELLGEDPAVVTWWGTSVECVNALARLERNQGLTPAAFRSALSTLTAAQGHWIEVPASTPVREQALRLLRIHPLQAGDALQLAAAMVASGMQPAELQFVSLDERQSRAAEREGFPILIG